MLVVLALLGCTAEGDPEKHDSGDVDTDTDVHADTDADTDADSDTDTDTAPPDADGDGYASDSDCDGANADVHPGAQEACEDGVDDDCDGADLACDRELTTDEADGVIVGTREEDRLYLAGLVDLDGDGTDEVGVSVREDPGDDYWSLYFLDAPIAGTVDASSAIASVLVGPNGKYLNSPLAADVDGDAVPDLVVGSLIEGGALEDDDYQQGALYVFPGPAPLGREVDEASLRLDGTGYGGTFGADIEAGTLDRDGGAALVATEAGSGTVWVVETPLEGTYTVDDVGVALDFFDDPSLYGVASVEVTDHDGDGIDDVLVGDWQAYDDGVRVGAVYLLYGPITQPRGRDDVDATILGEAEGSFGFHFVTDGDVDGDGLPDLLVSLYNAGFGGEAAGRAWLFTGPIEGTVGSESGATAIIDGEAGCTLGSDLALGDLDSDGLAEVVVGAAYAREVLLFRAPAGSLMPDDAAFRIASTEDGDAFGRHLDLGHLDEDAWIDLAVSAYLSSGSVPQGGATYTFHGISVP
ncbi:MAG: putative metal-binding motif-containing protein [Myxococcota bacterium]